REAGVAGDDEEARGLREVGGDVLSEAVGEEILFSVGAQARERGHGGWGVLGEGESLPGGRLVSEGGGTVDLDGLCDVLHLAWPEVLKSDRQFAPDLIVHGSGNRDAARHRHRLEPDGDDHAVAVEIAALDDYIAHVDADTQDNPAAFV